MVLVKPSIRRRFRFLTKLGTFEWKQVPLYCELYDP